MEGFEGSVVKSRGGYFRWMKKRWMVGMHHSITPGGRKDRCRCAGDATHHERSSSRWGFRFPWRPDLPRFSPLGQGHPGFLRTFLHHPSPRLVSSRLGISHNRCVFTPPPFFSPPKILFSRGFGKFSSINLNLCRTWRVKEYRCISYAFY